MLFHEAEDIVLEAAKKRRQAHSQTQSSAGNQLADRGTQQQPSRPGQAPPPPPPPLSHPGNLEGSTAPGRQNVLPEAADMASSRPRHTDADLDDLAVDLSSLHVATEAQGRQADGVSTSEQDSEGYWSESHWDSSASYTGPDQQTSDSDHQHDSSDAEHACNTGEALMMQASWNNPAPHNMLFEQFAASMCTLRFIFMHAICLVGGCMLMCRLLLSPVQIHNTTCDCCGGMHHEGCSCRRLDSTAC